MGAGPHPPTIREIALGVAGAWRLARFDLNGLAFFDISAAGAARSFWAGLLVAPAYFAMIGLRGGLPATVGLDRVLLESLGYVVAWCAFPVLLSFMLAGPNVERRYHAWLCAYNWSATVQMAVYLPTTLLAESGVLPLDLAAGLSLGVTLAMLFYQWFIVRATLGATRAAALMLVLMDLVCAMVVNATIDLAY